MEERAKAKAVKQPGQVVVDLLDYREPLDAWCAQFGATRSKVIRRLVADFLALAAGRTSEEQAAVAAVIKSKYQPADVALILAELPQCNYSVVPNDKEDGQERQRCSINLTPSEYEKATEVTANVDGFSLPRWFAAALRARLTGQPQFGEAELKALAESNRALWSIARDVNLIARAVQGQQRDAFMQLDAEKIDSLVAFIKEHTEQVGMQMAASYERWRIE